MLVRLVWSPRRAALVYPIPPAPRTAVLMPVFRATDSVRIFPDGWTEEAKQFEPQALAGSFRQLEALAGRASPSHALIVIRREFDPGLTDVNRDSLWKAFRVPAFEQVIDESGGLLATECEAHDGLHIESSRFPGFTTRFKPDSVPAAAARPA
jgi:hypothetical protein